jgi:hypothetical protein
MLKQRIVLISLLVLILSGCSKDSELQGKSEPNKAILKSGWNCTTESDGIGENFGCFSSSNEAVDGVYWGMTVMCTSDLVSRHSIAGFNREGEYIIWPNGEIKIAKIRIDSNPIEEWKMTSKARGQALIFTDSAQVTSLNADLSESRNTWDLLSAIAGADTFGFKATDAEGVVRSHRFNITDSVPIAAKFSSLGCNRQNS